MSTIKPEDKKKMIYTIMFPLDSWSSFKKKEFLKIITLLENSKI